VITGLRAVNERSAEQGVIKHALIKYSMHDVTAETRERNDRTFLKQSKNRSKWRHTLSSSHKNKHKLNRPRASAI